MDIHVETLLEQIKLRPVLWDITSSMYKNKILKKEAWAEVCSFLVEGYAEKSNAKKDYIGKQLLFLNNNNRCFGSDRNITEFYEFSFYTK